MPFELVADGDTSWGDWGRGVSQFLTDLETAGVTAANIAELIRDRMGSTLVAGTGITVTVNDAGDTITVAAIPEVTITTQTASYTLGLSNAGQAVRMNVGTANNLTVPPNSSVAFPVGTTIEIIQYGAGQTTLVQGTGVNLRSSNGLKLRTQYSTASLLQIAANEWSVAGDVTP